MLETINDKLRNEKTKMQEIVYNAIVDFEITTGCQVVEVDLDSEHDGKGNAKTSYVGFAIKL